MPGNEIAQTMRAGPEGRGARESTEATDVVCPWGGLKLFDHLIDQEPAGSGGRRQQTAED